MYDDDSEVFEERAYILGPHDVMADGAGMGVGKKKRESHKTNGFSDKEDLVLYDSWLVVSQDSICGPSKKKRKSILVNQEFHERRMQKPYNTCNTRNQESIKKS
jgi:hypothetical protein